jgi:hypothetical protein
MTVTNARIGFYLGLLAFPLVALAQGNQLENPLSGVSTIWEFLDKIMDFLVKVAIPIIIFFLIWAGFKFVTAGGNEKDLAEAKQTIKYVLIGAAIILSARILTAVLVATVGQVTG